MTDLMINLLLQLVESYITIPLLFLLDKVLDVIIINFGQMMLFVMEMKLIFIAVLIQLMDYTIVILQQNALNCSVLVVVQDLQDLHYKLIKQDYCIIAKEFYPLIIKIQIKLFVMMDLTNKVQKFLVQNFMVIDKFNHSQLVIDVLIKSSGLMMSFAMEMNNEFKTVHILISVFIIVIGKLNVFNYSVQQEDLIKVHHHQYMEALLYYPLDIMVK